MQVLKIARSTIFKFEKSQNSKMCKFVKFNFYKIMALLGHRSRELTKPNSFRIIMGKHLWRGTIGKTSLTIFSRAYLTLQPTITFECTRTTLDLFMLKSMPTHLKRPSIHSSHEYHLIKCQTTRDGCSATVVFVRTNSTILWVEFSSRPYMSQASSTKTW